MAQWVSFKTIKEQVSIEQILEHYGLLQNATRKSHELRIRCPFHDDAQPSFTVHTQKNGFHCFGCGAKGNIFSFVRLKEGIDSGEVNKDDRKAAFLIAEWFGIASAKPDGPQARTGTAQGVEKPALDRLREKVGKEPPVVKRTEPVETTTEPLHNAPLAFAFKNLDDSHPYLAKRGFTEETIMHFGVGYHAGRGIMSGRVVIPIHNERSELVAYAGRWPGDEGWPEGEDKYKLPPGFHKSLVVFNLHQVRELVRDHGLIIAEGFFDVMRLWQAGILNAVALMGSSMSEAQERLIIEAVGPQGHVALLFDEDPAGWRCREEVLMRLSSHMYVKVVGLGEEGMQPDRLSDEEIKRLLG
jgi:DNA primase